jgi:hypothetical protein
MILTWSFWAWTMSLCPVLIYCQKKSASYVCTELNIWPSSSNFLQSFALHELHDHELRRHWIISWAETRFPCRFQAMEFSASKYLQCLQRHNLYVAAPWLLESKTKRLKSVAILFAVWMRLQYIIDIIDIINFILLWFVCRGRVDSSLVCSIDVPKIC